MRVEWSEAKRESNLRKHNLDFVDARRVFEGPVISFEDDRFDYIEDRYVSIGMLKGIVVVIAHTDSEEAVRVISMRKATDYERRFYLGEFADGLENSGRLEG